MAFVESGFSTTKYVVTGRNTLSLESVKAQKVVLSGIRAAGGAHLVLISANLLNSVNMAQSRRKLLMIRKRLWQIGKLRKLLQENKLQRKGKRSRRLSRETSILQNTALLSTLTDFMTNLYIQIVYTIRKFGTLLEKIVHYTISFGQE